MLNQTFKNLARYCRLILFGLSLYLFFTTYFTSAAFASTTDRVRECKNINGEGVPSGLEFSEINGGSDFTYEADNPICWAVVLPPYVNVKFAIAAMNKACNTGSPYPRVTPSPLQDFMDIKKAGTVDSSRNPACVTAFGYAVSSYGVFIAVIAVQYGAAKEVYDNSKLCGVGWKKWNPTTGLKDTDGYKRTVETVMDTWRKNCADDASSADCLKINDAMSQKEYREYIYQGFEMEDFGDKACPDVTREYDKNNDGGKININNKDYPTQRYYMRGTDAGNYACERFNKKLVKNDRLDNQTPHGPLSVKRAQEYDYAYQCCINRSRNTACIERKLCKSGAFVSNCVDKDIATVHKFCSGGEHCKLNYGSNLDCNNNRKFCTTEQAPDQPVKLNCKSISTGCDVEGGGKRSTTNAEFSLDYTDNNRMICVSSYDKCPYNFNIGGGSETCNYYKDGITSGSSFKQINLSDIEKGECEGKSEIRKADCSFNDKAGKCENYCQQLNHCVILAANTHINENTISSPYFSNACFDFIGDSKNSYGYDTGIIAGSQKHFTAPIAQCIRETLENVFNNKAGHTRCATVGEYPDAQGRCFTDHYVYKKGFNVDYQRSFFVYIQDNIRDIIKLIITVSVILQGMKILLTGKPVKLPEMFVYVVKIALVLFFVTSNAWQGFFFEGVYNASTTIANIVTNIRTSPSESKQDGCQFGSITASDGKKTVVSSYPQGKEYIAIFDTLDCKIARYLGFGPSATVATVAKLVLASYFTGPIGIYFAILTMIFGIFMIIIAIRTLHIFLTSAFAIILMIYVSPITITAALFKKTEGIFNKWFPQLISFTLQPVILFAYIGFLITIFETLVTGSATFSGKPPTKNIVCNKSCVKPSGELATYTVATGTHLVGDLKEIADCEKNMEDKVVDPMSDSVACIMNLSNDQFGSIPILEPFGVAIPILKDLFTERGREKILTLTKAALIIYILVGFLDEIPGIASNIGGGASLPGPGKMSIEEITKNLAGVMLAIEKRTARGGIKLTKGAVNEATKMARKAGNLGKSVAKAGNDDESGGDNGGMSG